MALKADNIIVGLLKNFLRKNITHGKEFFILKNKHSFKVELDVSGFDEDLITESLEELHSNLEWLNIGNEHVLLADINNVEYNVLEEMVSFTMPKEKLIKLRDSII